MEVMIAAWAKDKNALPDKAIIAGLRADVTELNQRARSHLKSQGLIPMDQAVHVEVELRDGMKEERELAVNDRIVFTKNDRELGVLNGMMGTLRSLHDGRMMMVELDETNARGESSVAIPFSFGFFDHAYCITNHKAQGRISEALHAIAARLIQAAQAPKRQTANNEYELEAEQGLSR